MSRRVPGHVAPGGSRRWSKFPRLLRELQAVWRVFRNPPRLLMLCGRYPDDQEAKDGFFQRVLAVDRMLSYTCLLYLELGQTYAGEPLRPVGNNGTLLTLSCGLSYRLFVHFSRRIRFIYYHSSLSTNRGY